MANQNKPTTPSQIYGNAGLIYIQYHATIDNKPSGQKKINRNRPPFSTITEQKAYTQKDGKYISLLMGREFKLGRWAILLDFDKKEEGNLVSGLELEKLLEMKKNNAPKQLTPSGRCHYIF
jgi:hypothetical protein